MLGNDVLLMPGDGADDGKDALQTKIQYRCSLGKK